MDLDYFGHSRRYSIYSWCLGLARISLVAGMVLLVAGPLYAAVAFLGFFVASSLAAGALSFSLRCPSCGERQTSVRSCPPVRTPQGKVRSDLARFFMPDPIALGRFACVSCGEVFSLAARRAA